MLIDITKCIGCEKCVMACVKSNDLGKNIPMGQHTPDGLSAKRFTSIFKKRTLKDKKIHYIKKQCRHCLEPACVSACLVGAMQKSPEGPVIYDADKCMGCRYCMVACPYGIPKYEWEKPIPYVKKCNFCYERTKNNQKPECVQACPKGALTYGERDELIALAKKTIKENPGVYVNKVYGELEVGGTSVMYISDIPLEFLRGERDPGKTPLPSLTWQSLSKVPHEFVGMGAIMASIYWIVGRRVKLQQQRNGAAEEQSTANQEVQENNE